MEKLLAKLGYAEAHELAPYAEHGLRILLILVMAWLLNRLARRLLATFQKLAVHRTDDPEAVRRAETLAHVLRYAVTVVILALTVMLVLSTLGIPIAPILGAAGVVGVAVGFGAQSLVKDFLKGFSILLENQIRVGDLVEVAGKSGLVEEVTLRNVRLRSQSDGRVHFVPTGSIDIITNMSLEYAYAMVDVGVAYRENLDEVFEVIRAVGADLRQDVQFAPRVLADLEVLGVEDWADSAVKIRCRLKVVPLEQWVVRRELLKRLKAAFDTRGIEIPFPHMTVYAGQLKDGSAPGLHLLVENQERV
jgi:small conductance mechanosensitive channel